VVETGANVLSLTVAPLTVNSLRSTLGADFTAVIDRDRRAEVTFRLGWQHEFGDTGRSISAQFAGAPGAAFTEFGATPQRDSAAIGMMARGRVAEATELYARYDGQVGGGTDNHAFSAGLRMTW
jgi:outer membrane autotransporter protein